MPKSRKRKVTVRKNAMSWDRKKEFFDKRRVRARRWGDDHTSIAHQDYVEAWQNIVDSKSHLKMVDPECVTKGIVRTRRDGPDFLGAGRFKDDGAHVDASLVEFVNRLEIAAVILKPGCRVGILDADNRKVEEKTLYEAVACDDSFYGEVRDDILAVDFDNVPLTEVTGVHAALEHHYGLSNIVIAGSGGPSSERGLVRKHLFVRIPNPALKRDAAAKVKALCPKADIRTYIRPIGTMHRSRKGRSSTTLPHHIVAAMLSPAIPGEAARRILENPAEDRSAAIFSAVRHMQMAGVTLEEIRSALEDSHLRSKWQCREDDYILRTWLKAMESFSNKPKAAEPSEESLEDFEQMLMSWFTASVRGCIKRPKKGSKRESGPASALSALCAMATIHAAAKSEVWSTSVRTVQEASALASPSEAGDAVRDLRRIGALTLVGSRRAWSPEARRYSLSIPEAKSCEKTDARLKQLAETLSPGSDVDSVLGTILSNIIILGTAGVHNVIAAAVARNGAKKRNDSVEAILTALYSPSDIEGTAFADAEKKRLERVEKNQRDRETFRSVSAFLRVLKARHRELQGIDGVCPYRALGTALMKAIRARVLTDEMIWEIANLVTHIKKHKEGVYHAVKHFLQGRRDALAA